LKTAASRFEPVRRGQGSSVAIDAAAIAVLVIARQSVRIVVDLDGRNESGRDRRDRVSLRLLYMMKSAVMLNIVAGRVRGERGKNEAHRKNDRRNLHFGLHSKKRSSELDFIE
jgi:hypothetical protein